MDSNTYETFRDSWWPVVIAIIVGTLTFIRTYIGGQECPNDNRITDKIVLITGASGGIGLQTAKELAKRGGKIILTCRNVEKGKEAALSIKRQTPSAVVDVKQLDISNLQSIKEFCKNLQEYDKIDILINNAGIMFYPHELTPEGFEIHFVTNYLGHFLLTHLLLTKLKASENGRVINISAQAYVSGHINIKDYNLKDSVSQNNIEAFTQSKLALILMARYMGKLLKGANVTINSVDPGLVRNTKHMDRSPLKTSWPVKLSVWPWMWLFLKTPKQGSQTIVYLATDPKLSNETGKHYSNCEPKQLADNCKDENIDKELYDLSCSLVKIKPLV